MTHCTGKAVRVNKVELGRCELVGRIYKRPSWANTRYLAEYAHGHHGPTRDICSAAVTTYYGPLQYHWQQQLSILWAHSCILSMTLQVNSGPIQAHRQIPPSVLGPYMGLMQFPYMCLVGPYEAHTEYIFMGPYIYMHLSYTMGPRRLYRGVREIVTWALPSTMTQICVMGSKMSA